MKKSKLRNIIRESIKELIKEQTTPNSHNIFTIELCKPPHQAGQQLTFNPLASDNGIICNGAMCTPSDIGQTFESTQYGPPPLFGPGVLKFKLVSVDFNSLHYVSTGTIIDFVSTNCPGCSSGANSSFQFTGGCDPNANYHTWPSGYSGFGSSFTWNGTTVTNPTNGNTYNNGDNIDMSWANFLLANQSSYCEWCDDFANGNNTQLNQWLPLWHDSSFQPISSINPPEAHCCCCPGQGGNPMNPMGSPLAKIGGDEEEEIEFEPYKPSKPKDKCCNWCDTVNPNLPSIPPPGCEDFDCDKCPPTVIERMQKLANIKK